ncbi:MAG: tetratricopeptide repeat protein [Acidobacteria bacterium]|nr:tetratricopeptide repeat protein [Acidobacteriota bacterium]
MNLINTPTTLLICAFVLFSGVLHAQSYQEMDAEAAAASERLWDSAFLDPIAKKVATEFDAGNFENAVEEANKFLAYAPDAIGGIQLNRGRAHFALYTSTGDTKHFTKARADFLYAILNKPEDVWNRLLLGHLYFAAKLGLEADREYSKALAMDPASLSALRGKAAAAYYARDMQGCVNAIKGVMAHPEYKKDNDAWYHFRLGQCYAVLGDKANAKQNFEKAVAMEPGWKSSWPYMAFAKDGYTCKPAGRKSPDKPFDRYVHDLRAYHCPGGGAISLFIAEKEDPNPGDDGLFHETEFKRVVNQAGYPESLTYGNGEMLYNDAIFWLESARRRGKSIDMKARNEFLEVLNHALNIKDGVSRDRNAPDYRILARYERAKLLLGHPDKQIKLLAWKDQVVLSNIPAAEVAGKPVANNGADVKTRIIRGRMYAEVKDNQRAAVAEFDAAINILRSNYGKDSITADAPIMAELYWRNGDALAKLGEVDKAAIAYADSLQVSPINPDAIAGLERLRISPQVSANRTAANKVYEIEQMARINEIAAQANKAYSTFQASTGSGRTLKQKCDATSIFYGKLADERGKLISLGGNIAHGTKLREHYTNTLNSIDNAMKLANSGLSAC